VSAVRAWHGVTGATSAVMAACPFAAVAMVIGFSGDDAMTQRR
jgi:hypothetical protein